MKPNEAKQKPSSGEPLEIYPVPDPPGEEVFRGKSFFTEIKLAILLFIASLAAGSLSSPQKCAIRKASREMMTSLASHTSPFALYIRVGWCGAELNLHALLALEIAMKPSRVVRKHRKKEREEQ
jgi:hypothetical protein